MLAATKEREKKLNEFTIKELGQLEGGATTYKAVGKMWVGLLPGVGCPGLTPCCRDSPLCRVGYLCSILMRWIRGLRFLQAAPTELVADLEKQNETTQKDLDALGKKREWLERQISDLNGTLKDVMKTSGR